MAFTVSRTPDLILDIRDHRFKDGRADYAVDSKVLEKASAYFHVLLDPQKFFEGRKLHDTRESFGKDGIPSASTDIQSLPRVIIHDVGAVSGRFKVENAVAELFHILHGREAWARRPPLTYLTNIAIVADRFECLSSLVAWSEQKKLVGLFRKKTFAEEASESEGSLRQKLLTGWLLQYSWWVQSASASLILRGSDAWKPNSSEQMKHDGELWWSLPGYLEDELLHRRTCILESLQSLQDSFLRIYSETSQRQCRLGDSRCDSYQFGEIIRFFNRTGTLRLDFGSEGVSSSAAAKAASRVDTTAFVTALSHFNPQRLDINHRTCNFDLKVSPLGSERLEKKPRGHRTDKVEAICSLQEEIIRPYLNPMKYQCKRGYDTSPQCDILQLGELARFLGQNGSLRLESLIYDEELPERLSGIHDLILALRAYNPRKLDSDHAKCSIRSRLLQRLEFIYSIAAYAGMSMKAEWSDSKTPNKVASFDSFDRRLQKVRREGNRLDHVEMCVKWFNAPERDWSLGDGLGQPVE